MKRRTVLGSVVSPFVAGCTGSRDESPIRDTDGDGVIDSEDYAPKDPAVQEKEDLAGTPTIPPSRTDTPTATPLPSATPTVTETPTLTRTETPTPTGTQTPSQSRRGTIRVSDEYWADTTRLSEYGTSSVEMVVKPDWPVTEYDETKVYLGAFRYPRGSVVASTYSEPFRRSAGTHRLRVDVDMRDAPSDQLLQYLPMLLPASDTIETASTDQLYGFVESDPFTLTPGGGIEPSAHSNTLAEEQGDGYTRTDVEGSYVIDVEGRTAGKRWRVNIPPYKSAYVEATTRSRGRSRAEYVSYELTEGTAPDLASVLAAEPFNYDMVLIQPPGHMAAGIWGTDLSGTYYEYDGRKYYYIETTGEGWGIGDIPDTYRGEDARVFQV